MHFAGSRGHPKFNLDGGLARGKTQIIQAAKDPVRVPEDPSLVALIQRCLCKVSLGEDCWIVKGMTGDELIVSYNDPPTKWAEVCEQLLDMAMKAETEE